MRAIRAGCHGAGKARRPSGVLPEMKPIPVIATAALAALTATGAIAATSHPTVKAAGNAKLGHAIVIEAKKGMSLYYLVGDKEGRLCKTQCIGFWPPLTVKSLHTKV